MRLQYLELLPRHGNGARPEQLEGERRASQARREALERLAVVAVGRQEAPLPTDAVVHRLAVLLDVLVDSEHDELQDALNRRINIQRRRASERSERAFGMGDGSDDVIRTSTPDDVIWTSTLPRRMGGCGDEPHLVT